MLTYLNVCVHSTVVQGRWGHPTSEGKFQAETNRLGLSFSQCLFKSILRWSTQGGVEYLKPFMLWSNKPPFSKGLIVVSPVYQIKGEISCLVFRHLWIVIGSFYFPALFGISSKDFITKLSSSFWWDLRTLYAVNSSCNNLNWKNWYVEGSFMPLVWNSEHLMLIRCMFHQLTDSHAW